MLQNFVRIALRSLLKQKVYSTINITGFAVSMAACLLILVYVQHELSFDDFNPKGDRIYKMALERIYPDHRTFYAVVPHSLIPTIKKDFPEVENTLFVNGPLGRLLVNYKSGTTEIKSFEEEHFIMSDSNFFDFFNIELIKGDKNTVLSKPRQVMITASTAARYFGNDDPMGKVIDTDAGDFTVAGVCQDLPKNTHLQFDFVGSIESFPGFRRENFTSFTAHAYIMLKPGAQAQALEAKFPKMVDTYAAAQIERELNQSWADYTKAGNGYRYFLQPLTSIAF
jgi:putative ABC transport system permease protein